MGKKKKSYSLEDLRNIKIDEEGFKEKTKGEIVEMEAEEKINNSRQKYNMDLDHIVDIPLNRKAKAPYNFVPLNKKVIVGDEPPAFDTYHKNKYTGYIKLNITNKTPIFSKRSD